MSGEIQLIRFLDGLSIWTLNLKLELDLNAQLGSLTLQLMWILELWKLVR